MWEPSLIYSKFILRQPTILFGLNAINGLITYPMSKTLIIHGKSLNEDYKNQIFKSLSAFKLKFVEKSWEGEPNLSDLKKNLSVVENFNPDIIIAIGGGSVIDGAKMVRTYFEFPFIDHSEPKFFMLNWKTKFIAIPTTIGSGAEISSSSVMFNKKHKTKEFIINHNFIPDVIVFEEVLIKNCPEKIIRTSIVDSLSHCIEGYMSKIDNSLADIYAEKAVSIIASNTKELKEANLTQLQLASYFGGIVQNHCIVGAAHSLAHQITCYEISHSSAICIFLSSAIKENIKVKKNFERLNRLSLKSGFCDANEFLEFLESLISKINLNVERETLKINKKSILNDKAFFKNALADKGGQGNPVELSESLLRKVFTNSI